MPLSPTCIPIDISRRYFTESLKIFIVYATITDGIFCVGIFLTKIFFCVYFSFVKPSVFFFTNKISEKIWNKWWTIRRRTLAVSELVSKKFTDEVIILHRRIRFVDKTIQCCNEQLPLHVHRQRSSSSNNSPLHNNPFSFCSIEPLCISNGSREFLCNSVSATPSPVVLATAESSNILVAAF